MIHTFGPVRKHGPENLDRINDENGVRYHYADEQALGPISATRREKVGNVKTYKECKAILAQIEMMLLNEDDIERRNEKV